MHSGDSFILVIDDERSELLNASPVPQLSLDSSHPAGGVTFMNASQGANMTKEHHGVLGLLESLNLVGNDLGDLSDLMTLGYDECQDSGGGEHPSSVHVAVGGLAGTVGTSSVDTGAGIRTTAQPVPQDSSEIW